MLQFYLFCAELKKKKEFKKRLPLAILQHVKQALPCDLVFPPLGIYPKELKTGPHKNLPTNVHSGIIQNSARGKAPRVTIDR